MATAHEPEVSWSDYRAGKATLNEWVNGNRHIVAGGMFAFYVSLGLYFGLRPKKKSEEPASLPEVAPTETAK